MSLCVVTCILIATELLKRDLLLQCIRESVAVFDQSTFTVYIPGHTTICDLQVIQSVLCIKLSSST